MARCNIAGDPHISPFDSYLTGSSYQYSPQATGVSIVAAASCSDDLCSCPDLFTWKVVYENCPCPDHDGVVSVVCSVEVRVDNDLTIAKFTPSCVLDRYNSVPYHVYHHYQCNCWQECHHNWLYTDCDTYCHTCTSEETKYRQVPVYKCGTNAQVTRLSYISVLKVTILRFFDVFRSKMD